MLNHDLHIQMTCDGVLSRRAFLRGATIGAAGLSTCNWTGILRAQADELRKRGMACILVFMQGGPSQFETFDPKPGTETGGPTQAIDTAVPGVQIAEHWPKVARQLKDIALIRSMTGNENNHQRAVYLLHTGYALSASVKYPNMGSVTASELGDAKSDLPGFVSIGPVSTVGPGFLGAAHAPLSVPDPEQLPRHIALPEGVEGSDLKRRLGLLGKMEKEFTESGGAKLVTENRAVYETAARLVMSPNLKAFDLGQENERTRDGYGRTPFGQGCLLARRLIETGVTFVEVNSGGLAAATNWDTHRDNFTAHKRLAGPVDAGWTALIQDLKDRGLLDTTLVICLGEFGRTPTINGYTGRDHYARAFSVALAGGGIQGGRVIGSTDKGGIEVETRPVTVPDLFCTFYHALKINVRQVIDNTARPVRIVEGGEPVNELFA